MDLHILMSIFALGVTINESELDVPKAVPTQGSVETAIQLFFGVLAGVAVLIIIVAGIYFALSQGNPDKAARARNTIIYAAVGLIVAMLAVAVVSFVISRTA